MTVGGRRGEVGRAGLSALILFGSLMTWTQSAERRSIPKSVARLRFMTSASLEYRPAARRPARRSPVALPSAAAISSYSQPPLDPRDDELPILRRPSSDERRLERVLILPSLLPWSNGDGDASLARWSVELETPTR